MQAIDIVYRKTRADDARRRIHFKQALILWVSAFLSYLMFYIGFAMAAFTEHKRALHDFVAGPVVLDAAAIAAAKSWHYKQAVHNGKPVDDWMRLPVQFQQ
jgi:uncharacterized RDD family membrane protein YckC